MRDVRSEFPIFQNKMRGHPLVYLDSAATAQKPLSVIDSMSDFYKNHYATVHRAIYELSILATEAYHKARKKVQSFVKAGDLSEIIFTRGTTESINLVASSFGDRFVEEGDEILITEMEHHSNIVPWQLLAERKKARLVVLPFDHEGHLDLDSFRLLLSKKTKIAAFPHVSNVLGTINPIREMTAIAHSFGAKVLIDAAQSVPHRPIDVQEIGADFLVFSGHKVYGPTGIGVLYGRKELLEEMGPYQGGGDMIEKVTFEKTTYAALPAKFEAGTPMFVEAVGLEAALLFIESIGWEKILAHEETLLASLFSALETVKGLSILGGRTPRSSLVTFSVKGAHPLDIATLLDLKGIAIRSGHLCAQPTLRHFGLDQAARVSLGIYSTQEDISHFIESLQEVLWKLQRK